MSILPPADPMQITEAARRGVSKLVAAAEAGSTTVLRRREVPVAAVVSYQELERLVALERDLTDLALVLSRSMSDSGRRTPLDGVIEAAGYTREELADLPDPA